MSDGVEPPPFSFVEGTAGSRLTLRSRCVLSNMEASKAELRYAVPAIPLDHVVDSLLPPQ